MTNASANNVADSARLIKRLTWLVALAALLAVAAAGVFAYFTLLPQGNGPAQATVNELAVAAARAVRGDKDASKSVADGAVRLRQLAQQDAASAWARDGRLEQLLANADLVAKADQANQVLGAAVQDAQQLVPQILEQLGVLAGGFTGADLEGLKRPLERFELRAQRLKVDLQALVSGSGTTQAAQSLAESSDYMGQVIAGLAGRDSTLGLPRASGQAAEQRLQALQSVYDRLNKSIREAVSAAPALPAAQTASARVVDLATDLIGSMPQRGGQAGWWPIALALAVLLPLAWLLVKLMQLAADARRQRLQSVVQRRDTDRNQEAILRLLDELSSLADGDLTVQATVTEDITGAIADSINYAIDALRGLVTTINRSAVQLDGATRQTQSLAQQLAKASAAQAQQITSATESAGAMASSTEEISGNAERAADVARHSVDVAHKGGDAVRRTIDGMNTIRETIQETSKRIKRLGESSQEIGNIVELINDIAEQTNILALNASIQASMAGEAGRGFAVVADEVQRLAERAANATKQIEVLVRTIQTDTNEAVVSMERSTTDVVGGALLAENAGAALDEIEQVSNQIANLVQNISGSSRRQASGAQNVARSMQALKDISAQSTRSTNATSLAIAKLAELAGALRMSVSGFKLPEGEELKSQTINVPAPDFAKAGEPKVRDATAR
ncbi:MAG: methyl-accepting chemotaxis protein [Steroidobacteraceae bacterium]